MACGLGELSLLPSSWALIAGEVERQVSGLLLSGVFRSPRRYLGTSPVGEKGLARGRLGIFFSRWMAVELRESEPAPGK